MPKSMFGYSQENLWSQLCHHWPAFILCATVPISYFWSSKQKERGTLTQTDSKQPSLLTKTEANVGRSFTFLDKLKELL